MDTEQYEGPVGFSDGSHYAVVEDTDAREFARSIAQAHLDYATKRGDEAQALAAQQEVNAVASRSFERVDPDRRLVHDPETDTYRLATDDDLSHNDRYELQKVSIEGEDGKVTLTKAELDKVLAAREEGK